MLQLLSSLGCCPITEEKYVFPGPRTLTHAGVVFLLVKEVYVCLPRRNFGLSASRCPQRNYCRLELAQRVRLMVKEGLHNNQMRREKWFPPAVFETTTTTLYPLRKLVSVKDKPLDETLIARQKTRGGGLCITCPYFLSVAH